MIGALARLQLNRIFNYKICTALESHIGVELPVSIRGTGGGVSLQRAGLQVSHVGHQVEVVTTGHTAQLLENL